MSVQNCKQAFRMARRIAALAVAAVTAVPAVAQTYNLDFEIVNRTNQPIIGLWASPSNHDSWGRPFSKTFVPSGGGQSVSFNSNSTRTGCLFDIRLQFSEGAMRYWRGIDLCRIRGMQVYVSGGEVTASTW